MSISAEKLQKLGLHKNESSVYLALLEMGRCRAAAIIEQTKLHRNLVYTSLEELVAKKLVTKMEKGKVAVFEANDPKILKEMLAEKLETADTTINELRALMYGKPRDVIIYEGTEGIITTREKIAREILPNEKCYVMGISYDDAVDKKLIENLSKLDKQIIKRGGNVQALMTNEQDLKTASAQGLILKDNVRRLPFSVESPMWTTVFRDVLNISIIGNNPVTFSIRSQEAADGFKKYFEYFWNQDTYVLRGAEAIRNVWMESLDCKELRWIGARGYFIDKYPEMFAEIEEKAKKIKGLKWYNILDNESRGHKITTFPWVENKYLLSSIKNPNVVWLYGQKVAVSNWAENEPVIFVSENKALVQSYLDYFDELWNKK